MANRRFAVHEIRHVIARMRLGESDRQIAKAGLMGRVKAGKLRLLAQDLSATAPMDPLGAQLMEPRSAPIMEPFGDHLMEPGQR